MHSLRLLPDDTASFPLNSTFQARAGRRSAPNVCRTNSTVNTSAVELITTSAIALLHTNTVGSVASNITKGFLHRQLATC
jgi:hypothetical protein